MKWLKKVDLHGRLKQLKQLKKLPLWKNYTKWEWAIMIIGGLTIFYILINLFTAFGEQNLPPQATEKITLENSDDFENSLAASINSSVELGSSVSILTNGEEFLPDLLQEIKKAEKSIYITDYIWDGGQFGNQLFQALIEKAKEGVEVKVLLDGVSGGHASKKYIKELTLLGGEVAYFRPVSWWDLSRIDRRTHVRDFVIDGNTSYLGGIAISDLWLGNATSSKSWHDFMFKTHGVMASRLESVFANMWSQTTGEILAAPLKVSSSSTITNSTHFVSLFSAPAPDMSSNVEHFIWMSIVAAKTSIHIENPYLLPSKSIREALETKAKEGVDVSIIVPGKNTDTKYTRWASQSFYKELLRAGVKIYEYQPSRIHAKIMTIDGIWSVIGSANLDNRSSKLNLELIIGIEDKIFAKDLEGKFNEDLKKASEITKEAWSSHSYLLLPLELVSRLFIRQY